MTLSDPGAPTQPANQVVLIGLMGAGKSSVGRRLAKRLGLAFVDSDDEIAEAAGCSIPEIFARFGEPAFRDGERRVIARLLSADAQVLATGGGAFMNDETRALIRRRGISVWLRADLDTLVQRTARRAGERPLLNGSNPRPVLEKLMAERHPIYAEADVVVDTGTEPPDDTASRVLAALVASGRLPPSLAQRASAEAKP
ncbi:MAG: shikimate kinase [Rhodospirillales bacterium]|nr:MAG: shikimate kinase [Rhodospirillales bacterium]